MLLNSVENDTVVDANIRIVTVAYYAKYGISLRLAECDVVFFGNVKNVIGSPCDFDFHNFVGMNRHFTLS